MREARTLGSWVIALFLAVMLFWTAAEVLAPQPPTKNHLFELFRDSSGFAFFEPTGRFVFGALGVVAALLILVPVTRRAGAILATLLLAGMAALVGQLIMLGIALPVDTLQGGTVTTVETDPSALFYLVVALLASAIALIFIHPGAEAEGPRRPYAA